MDATSPAWGTEFTTWNGSEEASIETCISGNLTLSLLTLIIALGGLVGNGIVLWLLGFRMQRNTFSIYVLNLASADFFFLCCKIFWSLNTIITYYPLICNIPSFFNTVLCFTYTVGLSVLSALSSERCLSVLCPIWYRVSRPRHLSSVVCALLWVLSLLLNILEGYYCGFLSGESDHKWCCIFDFIMTAWLILLFVVLSGSSLALLTRILCGSRRMKLTRLYVTILLSGLIFLLCGLPFGIQFFLLYCIQQNSSDFYLQVGLVLSSVNSCANPIIYFFVGSCRQRWQLPQTLGLVLQKALQDIPETDESGSSLPRETMERSGSSPV